MASVFISHSSRDNAAAERIKNWLHSMGFDAPFLDFDKHQGIPPGADWERTLYREIADAEAMIILQTPDWMESKWCFAEFTQARALGKPVFPIIETPHGDTLISPDIQTLDLQSDRNGGLERLARELTAIALDAQGGFEWDRFRSPYPGLMAFQEEDAAIYFGRDDDIRQLIEKLNARRAQGGERLLTVLGASGSGKSSLMRAGVIPRLKRAGKTWIVVNPIRPRGQPLVELARTLAIATNQADRWHDLRDRLMTDKSADTMDEIVFKLREQHNASEASILLPIDQAEELFTVSEALQSARFLEILSTALKSQLPLLPIMTIRSDHLGDLQAAQSLSVRLDEFSLSPMPPARIPQIIEGPARVADLGLDDELVQMASHDAQTDDALPLLAFALRELYDQSAGNKYLSLSDYQALGDPQLNLSPLENAVRRRADAVIADANPDTQTLAALENAFVPAMVRINDQGDYVRQAARWDDLTARAHPLLQRLTDARLLVSRQEDGVRMIEVAHEALLRKWPLLRNWLDEAREFLIGKKQLAADIHDWNTAQARAKPSALLSGLKLTRSSIWLQERPHQLSEEERSFIQASITRDRTRVRRRRIQGGVVTLAISAFAVFAAYQWFETQKGAQARAHDQQNWAWMDLGRQSIEADRLSVIAQANGVRPELFINRPQIDGYDCQTIGVPGFRKLYCDVRAIINVSRAGAIAGVPVFLPDGPHGIDPEWKSRASFGHYNPDFLSWVGRYLIPVANDGRFESLKRIAYETYIAEAARGLYYTHQILFAEKTEYGVFLENYDKLASDIAASGVISGIGSLSQPRSSIQNLESIRAAYEGLLQYQTPLPPLYFENVFTPVADFLITTKGRDAPDARAWYMANTAAGFWVRRSIDGTASQIFDLVVKVLSHFEPGVLQETPAWQCDHERCF